jgi:hypothetical protein
MNQDRYLICNTDHFSIWIVAQVESPDTVPEGIHAYTVVALAIIATVVAAVMKRKKTQA